ncbi:peptide/nickel transport system permease protein [Saccharothrix carnea]|uniref:Peptide/nickel transport system permease protein n=1 Tax=Saccharothrix carnea TaxID=1280637 RepID=A0A2P8IGM3_SACCR|nr:MULTISPECIES: ABC transporter permease [Saccharothrix]OKI27209.1 ABC transporter permease [Saccharothrix sp. CB00851]PSL57603.1 peptide/nickel transport system permease protein [Saccharothrix carnea]
MTAIAWQRRRAAARATWREFASQRGGLVGLIGLAVITVLAVLAPLVTDASGLDVTRVTARPWEPPSASHWLGTDHNGRSVLLLTWWGTRISLVVGLAATVLSVLIGTVVGIAAAHFGGWVSAVLMRFTDFFLVLPSLVLAIALSTVLPRGLGTIVLAIGVTSWPATARLVRAQTLAVEARPFIERARALGGGHGHVIGRHVLPAVLPLVFVNTTLTVASAIVAESTLSFLGLGDPTRVSWGSLLHAANMHGAVSQRAWWFLVPPGLGVVCVVLAFTLCGRALETVLNPRLKGER